MMSMFYCPICGEETRGLLSTIAAHGVNPSHRCNPDVLAAIDAKSKDDEDEDDDDDVTAPDAAAGERVNDG